MQERDVSILAASDQITISICEPTNDTDPDSNARELSKMAVKILLE
jgi:hypothetical protein